MTTTKTSDVIQLSIPCLSDYVGVARLAVSGVATRMNFSIEEIEDIKIAVSEACTNSVQYAYTNGTPDPKINISCVLHEGKLEIIVEDQGQGYDVAVVEGSAGKGGTSLKENSSGTPSLGLGMTFIKSLMDESEFMSELGKGTTVRMVKHI